MTNLSSELRVTNWRYLDYVAGTLQAILTIKFLIMVSIR